MNNLLRIDGRPSGNNSYWLSYRQFSSNQFGSEITAGPAKWGFFDGNYVSGDSGINGGWNHVSSSNRVNEFGAGIRRATEGFGVKNDSDYAKFTRSAVGFTSAQFHPELNPQGLLPFVRFGLNTTGIDTPDFTYDNRLGSTAYDWLASVRDNFTWTRNTHTFKIGGHFEYMQNNEARGGNWHGRHHVQQQHQQPAEHELRLLQRRARRLLAVHRNRQVPRDAEPPVVARVVPAGHVAGEAAVDARLRRAVPLVLAVHAAGRPGRELRSVEVRPEARRRVCTSRRSSTARASPSIRSPDSRSTRSSSAPTCPAPATRPTGW